MANQTYCTIKEYACDVYQSYTTYKINNYNKNIVLHWKKYINKLTLSSPRLKRMSKITHLSSWEIPWKFPLRITILKTENKIKF